MTGKILPVFLIFLFPSFARAEQNVSLPPEREMAMVKAVELVRFKLKTKTDVSGYVKSLNVFTRTAGITPELADNPQAQAEKNEAAFKTVERIRMKIRTRAALPRSQRLLAQIDYDHQASFGSFVSTGDFRVDQRQSEKRQWIDLGQTLSERASAFYEHKLHRASIAYQTKYFDLETGRQQIPWGVGRFFTPTDLFNPFNSAQLELDERGGVDAVNLTAQTPFETKSQFIYTPRGRRLHPNRYLGRLSRDVKGYEAGVLGGRVGKDHAAGVDLSGNLADSAVRAEFLFREARNEKDFVKGTVNIDYNLPHNIYALLEYHFNGQGRRDPSNYQRARQVLGEIQQLAKNYLALSLGHDLTSLLRVENRTIFNLDDVSFFIRPEIQYEFRTNLLLTLAAHLFLGANQDEFGAPKNLYFMEAKYSF